MGDRFTIKELRGFPIGGNSAGGEGLSVQVLDNAYRRVLTTFRSEDYGGTRAHRQVIARWKADCFVARLTGRERPPTRARSGRSLRSRVAEVRPVIALRGRC